MEVLTVYAFSTENWNRDPIEVTTLMTIFAKYAETFRLEALAKDVRVNVLSTELDRLPPKVRAEVENLRSATQHCKKFTLNICLSYGGRGEILLGAKRLIDALETGKMRKEEITEEVFSRFLTTADYPGRPSSSVVVVPTSHVILHCLPEQTLIF